MIEYSREDIIKAGSIGTRLKIITLISRLSSKRYDMFFSGQDYDKISNSISQLKKIQKEFDKFLDIKPNLNELEIKILKIKRIIKTINKSI